MHQRFLTRGDLLRVNWISEAKPLVFLLATLPTGFQGKAGPKSCQSILGNVARYVRFTILPEFSLGDSQFLHNELFSFGALLAQLVIAKL